MSKEKQCECCHEWWYDSDVKENLCPNCYDYFNQLKQQLEESFTEEDVESLIEDRDKTIKFMQKELAEKDIRIEELEGQFAYECECNMQLVDLQKQLEEKQKTIDEINREFVQAVHDWKALCAEKDKKIELLNAMISTLPEHDKEIKEYELEKVKNYFIEECEDGDGIKTEDRVIKKDIYEVADFIENQIKELKGQDND